MRQKDKCMHPKLFILNLWMFLLCVLYNTITTLLTTFYVQRIKNVIYIWSFVSVSPAPLPVSQGNDTDITGAGEKAESSRYSRSYTSGATLGAELRRGRSRRLSSSLQVLKGSMGALIRLGAKMSHGLLMTANHPVCALLSPPSKH